MKTENRKLRCRRGSRTSVMKGSFICRVVASSDWDNAILFHLTHLTLPHLLLISTLIYVSLNYFIPQFNVVFNVLEDYNIKSGQARFAFWTIICISSPAQRCLVTYSIIFDAKLKDRECMYVRRMIENGKEERGGREVVEHMGKDNVVRRMSLVSEGGDPATTSLSPFTGPVHSVFVRRMYMYIPLFCVASINPYSSV